MKLALFDLDHTLIPIDSDHAWGEFATRIGWADAGEFKRRNDAFYEQYKAGTLDIHDYIRFTTEPVRRHGASASAQAHARFMREVIAPAIRPEARALVEQHRQAGDDLAVVTATNAFVTAPIVREFGIHHLVATIPAQEGGSFTGKPRGLPAFKDGKIDRVDAWLESYGLHLGGFERSWFYSDSLNDLPLLSQVSDPIAVDPDITLRTHAERAGWTILNLHL